MEMKDMIYRRRSVRSYREEPVDAALLAQIDDYVKTLQPLPDTKVEARRISTAQARFLQKWKTPHAFVFFAEDTEQALVSVGFMFQQLDLYLQTLGLGACWVGLGWLNEDVPVPEGMRVAVMMPFGMPDAVPYRTYPQDFKRKSMAEITDMPDDRLEVVRIAPSATNSQPWFITHDADTLHVYREKLGGIKQRTLGKMNPIDIGIALAHLYVTNPDTFRFWRADTPPEKDGFLYMGSVCL